MPHNKTARLEDTEADAIPRAAPPDREHPLTRLQRLAGNRAVADAVARGTLPVQRMLPWGRRRPTVESVEEEGDEENSETDSSGNSRLSLSSTDDEAESIGASESALGRAPTRATMRSALIADPFDRRERSRIRGAPSAWEENWDFGDPPIGVRDLNIMSRILTRELGVPPPTRLQLFSSRAQLRIRALTKRFLEAGSREERQPLGRQLVAAYDNEERQVQRHSSEFGRANSQLSTARAAREGRRPLPSTLTGLKPRWSLNWARAAGIAAGIAIVGGIAGAVAPGLFANRVGLGNLPRWQAGLVGAAAGGALLAAVGVAALARAWWKRKPKPHEYSSEIDRLWTVVHRGERGFDAARGSFDAAGRHPGRLFRRFQSRARALREAKENAVVLERAYRRPVTGPWSIEVLASRLIDTPPQDLASDEITRMSTALYGLVSQPSRRPAPMQDDRRTTTANPPVVDENVEPWRTRLAVLEANRRRELAIGLCKSVGLTGRRRRSMNAIAEHLLGRRRRRR